MKRLLDPFWLGIGTILVLLVFVLAVPETVRVRYSPRYGEAALAGKTPDQVIAQLGPPGYDPRKHGWSNERNDGPLFFTYKGGWAYCRIMFKDGKVVRVDRWCFK